MTFAEKLQTLRKSSIMSQENLADQIGVSRQAVSKWELGVSLPDMDKLIVISALFHVSIDYLVKDSNSDTCVNSTAVNSTAVGNTSTVQIVERVYYPWRYDYEYKSKRTLFGLPLVHINFGRGLKKAKGIIAIGNVAVGLVAIGCFSLGVISIGALAAGLISAGAIAVSLLLSVGGLAIGAVAIGGFAIGLVAFGGFAMASHIAVGGFAKANIAIGDVVRGGYTIHMNYDDISSVSQSQVSSLIEQEYPTLWKPVTNFITSLFSA